MRSSHLNGSGDRIFRVAGPILHCIARNVHFSTFCQFLLFFAKNGHFFCYYFAGLRGLLKPPIQSDHFGCGVLYLKT